MNFKKAGIFRRSSEGSEQPEVQNDSGGMLAVWGSPGSGKTVTAVKIAKMLSAKKKNVILLLCDMTAPMLPCICSPDELECERSLGNILAAARIGENLIKHNLVTLKRSNYLTVLGLLKGENEYSIPPFTEKQAIELLDGLRQIAPYVIVDCGSYIANDMHKDFVSPVKSIGHGITCTADLQTPEDVFRVMLELSQDVGHRLRVHELMACGVQVSIRTNDLYGSQYQCKLPFRTQLPNEIAGAGFHLLMERYRWDKPIRAITIRGIDLVSQKDAEQLSMFVDHQKRDRRILLEDAVEDIRRRFGKRAISYAILMGDLKIPDDGRQLVTMPGLMYQ